MIVSRFAIEYFNYSLASDVTFVTRFLLCFAYITLLRINDYVHFLSFCYSCCDCCDQCKFRNLTFVIMLLEIQHFYQFSYAIYVLAIILCYRCHRYRAKLSFLQLLPSQEQDQSKSLLHIF